MKILKLTKLEYDVSWNNILIGLMFTILLVVYLYNFNASKAIFFKDNRRSYLGEIAMGYLASSFVTVTFVSYIFSKSFSSQISSGLIKTWLCFPLKRSEILISKFLTGLLILTLAEVTPIIYSCFLYGFSNFFLIVVFAIFLKIFFYSCVSLFVSLIIHDALVSFTSSFFPCILLKSPPLFSPH